MNKSNSKYITRNSVKSSRKPPTSKKQIRFCSDSNEWSRGKSQEKEKEGAWREVGIRTGIICVWCHADAVNHDGITPRKQLIFLRKTSYLKNSVGPPADIFFTWKRSVFGLWSIFEIWSSIGLSPPP